MRFLRRALLALVAVYAVSCAFVYAVVSQTPARIGQVMGTVPELMQAVPGFRQIWFQARDGAVDAGDPAPGFDLARHDGSGRIKLSDLRGKPVLLVFGSYT